MLLADGGVDPTVATVFSTVTLSITGGICWLVKRLWDRIDKLETENRKYADDKATLVGKLAAAEMRLTLKIDNAVQDTLDTVRRDVDLAKAKADSKSSVDLGKQP